MARSARDRLRFYALLLLGASSALSAVRGAGLPVLAAELLTGALILAVLFLTFRVVAIVRARQS